METVVVLLGIVIGIYEILSRSIPTIKDYTILGRIIRVLKAISEGLNNRKSK